MTTYSLYSENILNYYFYLKHVHWETNAFLDVYVRFGSFKRFRRVTEYVTTVRRAMRYRLSDLQVCFDYDKC